MSKKNKKSTKRAQHAFDVKREKLEVVKKQLKVQKKQQQKATPTKESPKKKLKHKGIRIRKGVRIRGIKITDAASKKKARETLEAETALRKMEVESNIDWEEAAGSDAEAMED